MDPEDDIIPTEASKDRNFITALARGLDMLRAYRSGEVELSNTDLAARTGLPKPTVSRLTYTLCQLEYLVLNERTGAYRLGAGVLKLGFGVLAGMDIAARAQAVMKPLGAGPNSYVSLALAERHKFDAVYVSVVRSREDVGLHLHVGSRLPLFRSAIGLAILVAMSETEREAVLAASEATAPELGPEQRAAVAQALEDHAKRGFVACHGVWRQDVNGIAVPVRALDGNRVWGLNAGGPAFHVSPEELEETYAPRLIEASQALGPVHPESL